MGSTRPRTLAPHSPPLEPPAGPTRPPVRRNLFQSHLSRRPPITSSHSGDPVRAPAPLASIDTRSRSISASASVDTSVSTSASTLVLGSGHDFDLCGDIVIRDSNGDFEVGDPVEMLLEGRGEEEEAGDEEEDEVRASEKERQRLADAVKHHQRGRNRAPSEPAELLEAVRAVLRAKVAHLAEDEWMYEAEGEGLR